MKIKEIQKYILQAQHDYANVEVYYQSLNFKNAVRKAAEAMTSETAFAPHQRRVGKIKCRQGADKLLSHPFWLELENARSFEDIFQVTEKVKLEIKGLGDLWSYDTAQRIAFHKGWYPKEVYLHSGAKEGVKVLVNLGYIKSSSIRGKRHIKKELFPDILRQLDPYIIENILCVGKRKGLFLK
ncbi:hypothetical protein AB9P05_19230 [Roseivirga sp. BDSF3-8]|uniref:hypothetical protein n=1 Tax=Roseivirga sp. BDSF3-8 TaxID=3241598 RepID=UPI00353233F0